MGGRLVAAESVDFPARNSCMTWCQLNGRSLIKTCSKKICDLGAAAFGSRRFDCQNCIPSSVVTSQREIGCEKIATAGRSGLSQSRQFERVGRPVAVAVALLSGQGLKSVAWCHRLSVCLHQIESRRPQQFAPPNGLYLLPRGTALQNELRRQFYHRHS